jgi:hypothetical protein
VAWSLDPIPVRVVYGIREAFGRHFVRVQGKGMRGLREAPINLFAGLVGRSFYRCRGVGGGHGYSICVRNFEGKKGGNINLHSTL